MMADFLVLVGIWSCVGLLAMHVNSLGSKVKV